jgi:hypothetical protein
MPGDPQFSSTHNGKVDYFVSAPFALGFSGLEAVTRMKNAAARLSSNAVRGRFLCRPTSRR